MTIAQAFWWPVVALFAVTAVLVLLSPLFKAPPPDPGEMDRAEAAAEAVVAPARAGLVSPNVAICAVLVQARSFILSPDGIVRLGAAHKTIKKLAGLSGKAVQLDTCEPQGIRLRAWPNGKNVTVFGFSPDESNLPHMSCSFGVRQPSGEIELPACYGANSF